MSADQHGAAGATAALPEPAGRHRNEHPGLLLAALPAVLIGVLLRYWVGHTWLLSLNSDEALVGLQAREVLSGTFRLMVAGNDYGSTTESYLAAPLMLFSTGAWPLRLLAGVLSVVAAYALFRLARLFFGSAPALAIALVFWSASGAMVHPLVCARTWGTRPAVAAQIAACCAGLLRHAVAAAARPDGPARRARHRVRRVEPPDVRHRRAARAASRRRCCTGPGGASGGCRWRPAVWSGCRPGSSTS